MIDRIRREWVWSSMKQIGIMFLITLFAFFGLAGGIERFQSILNGEMGDGEFLALTIYEGIIVLNVIMLYRLFQSWQTSSLHQLEVWCKSQPNPEQAEMELNDLYEHTTPKFKLRINDKLLVYDDEENSFIAKTDDIFWIYPACDRKEDERERSIYLRYASDTELMNQICIEGGEESVERVLSYLQTRIPGALFGYSDELDSIYRDSYGLQQNAFSK